jgi:hypothetical protein
MPVAPIDALGPRSRKKVPTKTAADTTADAPKEERTESDSRDRRTAAVAAKAITERRKARSTDVKGLSAIVSRRSQKSANYLGPRARGVTIGSGVAPF